jgi:oligopeptide/dipeptide ABC transporter ATP-binding protein
MTGAALTGATAAGRSAQPLLSIRNLSVGFGSSPAARVVDGLDLDLPAGQITCLVGESGSGKTMTALSVLRLIPRPGRILPGSRILFQDRDLTAMTTRELRSVRGGAISMIFQEPMTSLNPAFTNGAQIAESVRLHSEASRREAWDRAVDLLDAVGISDPGRRARDFPHQLSGGMRQRVMIAMALSTSPKLLIADEPTTALDVTIQAQILDLLLEIKDTYHTGILLITHDVGVVAQVADEVAVMYAGRLVLTGPTGDCLERPAHPYLEALLRSVPALDSDRSKPLPVIPGALPGLAGQPEGCGFRPRCPHSFGRCREVPALIAVGRQSSACWLGATVDEEARTGRGEENRDG